MLRPILVFGSVSIPRHAVPWQTFVGFNISGGSSAHLVNTFISVNSFCYYKL